MKITTEKELRAKLIKTLEGLKVPCARIEPAPHINDMNGLPDLVIWRAGATVWVELKYTESALLEIGQIEKLLGKKQLLWHKTIGSFVGGWIAVYDAKTNALYAVPSAALNEHPKNRLQFQYVGDEMMTSLAMLLSGKRTGYSSV